jgi:hypothetical protein
MSDETGNGVFVLYCVSGCYAEVHISWESELISALASCVSSGDLYHASSHDIYQFLMLVSPALAFSTIDY